jgi:hypothetical protein
VPIDGRGEQLKFHAGHGHVQIVEAHDEVRIVAARAVVRVTKDGSTA